MRILPRRWILPLLACLPTACQREEAAGSGRFRAEIVDAAAPRNPWGKSAGDIDGDGLPDLLVGGHHPEHPRLWQRVLAKVGLWKPQASPGSLVWYRNPAWERRPLSTAHAFRTDHEVADVDGDGRNDVVALSDDGLLWLGNPGWTGFVVDSLRLHDVEVADLDGDGDLDLAARNQSLFGQHSGDRVYLYRQDSPDAWTRIVLPVPHGEGLRVADLDGDSRPDVVVNQIWLRNPGSLDSAAAWQARPYAPSYAWQDVFLDVGDVDGDGRADIAASPSEPEGKRYRISWFRAPAHPDSPWNEQVVDPDVEAVHHFLALRDMDADGDLDVAAAEMNQGDDPDEVKVYYGADGGTRWTKEVLSGQGSHSMRALDVDNDSDVDLFGADWEIEDYAGDYPATLWRNGTAGPPPWRRIVLDPDRPGQAVFIEAADLDGDGYRDVVAGAFWYRNPGPRDPAGRGPGGISAAWERRPLGEGAGNMVAVRDLDGDGDRDVLACAWRGYEWVKPPFATRVLRKLGLSDPPPGIPGNRFVWGRNDGKGGFAMLPVPDGAEGDFPQGVVPLDADGRPGFLISWHKEDRGIQRLLAGDSAGATWSWSRFSPESQDEALSLGDVDGDGDPDLVLGTRWLRNDSGAWTPLTLHETRENPDRNYLVDMDRDGRLDVVIGYEAISRPGVLAWYRQGEDPARPWEERVVDRPVGPMSLDVADFDADGDPDLVVGEHNLASPGNARLLLYENTDGRGGAWRTRVLHAGDEHHDGARAVDMDNDGDLDIISIGWGHGKVILYENPGRDGRGDGNGPGAKP